MSLRATYSAISALAVCLVLTFTQQMPDFDLWSRLQVGSIVWQTGAPLTHDIFSYSPTKPVWIDHEWGAGVVFYAFAWAFGNGGIFLAKGLLLVVTFAGLLMTISARGLRLPGLLFLSLLGLALLPGVASLVRSQAFTYAFFAWWLWGAERLRAGSTRALWLFPATTLAWANLHGGFLAGFGLLALYAVGEALARKSVRLFVLAAVLSIPASLVTPYGFGLWRYLAEAATMPRPYIGEWAAMPWGAWRMFPSAAALAGLALAVGVVGLARRRVDWTRVVVLVALVALGLRHQRHQIFCLLAVAALLFGDMNALLDPIRRRLALRWRQGLLVIATACFAAFALRVVAPVLSTRMRADVARYPVGSVEFVRANGITGNLAVPFDWGSYASWHLHPQCRVLIDGRYEEVYTPEAFDVAARFTARGERWHEALTRYHTDVVILPKLVYPPATMRELLQWRPVYEDLISVVLVPATTARADYVIPDFRIDAVGDLAKSVTITHRPEPPGTWFASM
jgi:hypothetical protein